MIIVIVGARTIEDNERIKKMVMGESTGYEFLLEFFDDSWDPQDPPYKFAAVVRCDDEQKAFELSLKFPTIPNSRLSYNIG